VLLDLPPDDQRVIKLRVNSEGVKTICAHHYAIYFDYYDTPRFHYAKNCRDRGLLHSPRQRQPNEPVQAVPREEGAVGGENKKEEGAVGGEESEGEKALQLLYESLSIEEPTQSPIPPALKPTEPPRQGRSRGRGVLIYSKESLRESPRERSVSRIAWVRRHTHTTLLYD
jgi:hypothetical protein